MHNRILGPDEARERLAAWRERIDTIAANTQAMSEQLRDVRATVSDPGELVEVTVDSTGLLVDLRLTDRIQHKPPSTAAQTILATLGEAKSRLADQSREIIAGVLGPESAAGQAMVGSIEQHLRCDQSKDGADTSFDEDDGYDIGSVMRRR
ncbi:MAG: YbaB/EbfC family nucleoid-associated protein [Saccharomonospora viridis]|jgi:DNA-binding protein YbaB|uniref:YbaB/EbfC family nucleoid-associated protein n=1 Tax=Saccharomonospora viridis TaxID=1852 RepID=UPI003D913283